MADTLFVIDTMYLIFRNFYAMRGNLRSPSGVPTGAVFGLLHSLDFLRTRLKMEYCVCCTESECEVFRHKISPIYKENRPPAAPELKVQIPLALEMCRHLGFKVLSADGFEADDVIASLTCMAVKKGWPVRIISKDKDMAQLLAMDGDIAIETAFSNGDSSYIDRNNCAEKYGVPPELIADWLALKGDTSDNVIGIKGIGDKTASKLLLKCGGLDELMKDPAAAGRFAAAIEESRERLLLNKRLVELRADACAGLTESVESIEQFRIAEPDAEAADFFANLGISVSRTRFNVR